MEKFINGWVTILAFVINKTKTDLDNKIVEELAAKLKSVADANPTRNQLVDAIFDIFEWVAEQTKTPIDDVIIEALNGLFGGNLALGDQFKVRHFIKTLFKIIGARMKVRRAKRKAEKSDKDSSTEK